MRFPLLFLITATAFAADEINAPKAAAISPEQAVKTLAVAPGLRVDLWASEPLLKDPVAFTFDNTGRCYIAETGRRRTSMQDIRKNEDWIIENLALRSVEDRVAFLKKKLAPELKLYPDKTGRQDFNKDGQFDWRDLEFETETIRVIEDSDGDGRADKSRVLAEGFNSIATCIGAGIVVGPDGNLYYTCAPDLWLIKPDGTKQRLSTGYGAHVVFSGHDMHGLRIGPDGRVYFSIGDMGASVMGGDGKKIECPDSGAVFRCWPDGTGLELFAWGLRNPQHLAFNDVGDLFTCDNNADGVDKARLIHVVEGGDYGWRIGHQFMPNLGVWNSEGWWHLDAAEKNASILPPVAHIGHGPAGFSFYPGTGLPEKYAGHFFMADFPGGVRAFKLKQKGATYEVDGFAPDAPVLQHNAPGEMTAKLLWNLDPSDVQFAPGGGVYVLDWTKGWEKSGRGRIFHVHDPATDASPIVQETKRLLAEDFGKKSADELATLLGHADQRVRMKAQFELVNKRETRVLNAVFNNHDEKLLPRLHAAWGIGQIARTMKDREQMLEVVDSLGMIANGGHEPELVAHVCKIIGDLRVVEFAFVIVGVTGQNSARVRFQAFVALSKLVEPPDSQGRKVTHGRILDALGDRHFPDSFLKHALQVALAGNWSDSILSEPRWQNKRLVPDIVLQALRRLRAPSIDVFLSEREYDFATRLEAARAIHDVPIPEAMPALAARLAWDGGRVVATASGPFARRVVNANYRLGTAECAKRLADAAANAELPEPIRADALDALASWPVNLGRDRVLGLVMPADGKRSAADAASALGAVFAKLAADKSDALRIAALDAAGANKAKATEPAIAAIANDAAQPGRVRAAALAALDKLDAATLPAALKLAHESTDAALLETARRISTNRTPGLALDGIIKLLKKGAPAEQRQAIETLGRLEQKGVDEQLGLLVFKMKSGLLPATLHLDVLDAAAKRSDPTVKTLLREWDKMRKADDPLARWRECLEGGDAIRGGVLFQEKAEAGCMRCHKANKIGGDVGPELAGLGVAKGREYLLRAIVLPDAEIAAGYDNVLVTLNDGSVLAGIVSAEDAASLTLKSVTDGRPQTVKKPDIKERTKLPSAMIPGLGEVLTKRELRDLIEYLATLK